MKNESANNIVIIILLLASFIASSFGELTGNITSIAFLIAGVYGIVCLFKNEKFLF